MSQYLVLIYNDEKHWAEADQKEFADLLAAHRVFQEANAASILGSNALEHTGSATSIRTDADGGFSVTDGPFAETKEALGGYYLIEAPDLDAALRIAKQVPAPVGGVEVRPIHVFE